MKITQAVIRNFKCFHEERFDLEGNLAVAGPNNSGKTTLLQAIATWSLALERWFELNDFQKHGGFYAKAPVTRQTFYSVPLRNFDLLWSDGKFNGQNRIELGITTDMGSICIEVERDSSEQVYVRPSKDVTLEILKKAKDSYQVFFVPSVSGLGVDEPVYQRPKINQLLGQGKSGDVLRNLLAEISSDQDAWDCLTGLIERMFGYELLPPDDTGAHILAEYRQSPDGVRLDINSAGSGFLQALLLLTFLIQQKGSVLLLDEPDAHLHVILQDTIYGQLKKIARKSNSQLIIATHSDAVINAVEPRDLLAMLGHPRKLASEDGKSSLIRSLSILSNTDILLAQEKERILYVEGRTDLNILMEWASSLEHPLADFLQRPFWKPVVFEMRSQGKGIKAQEHFDALLLVQEGMRGVQVVDRDGNENIPARQEAAGGNLLKLCWARYEIESYLVHPDSLARFVGMAAGENSPLASIQSMKKALEGILPESAINDPLGDHATLVALKARRDILPLVLDRAGLHGFSYTRYDEIASAMLPDEIHPNVIETLDTVADHFNL
ncbi:MAG: AAA family ATPase [Gammaproteobacteria bacterium]|nr:AAA family ATPase [Gammaproteobacteria bacterium]